MTIRLFSGDIHLIDLQTRLPFKYGIATMTRAPQAFVRINCEVGGSNCPGVAADVLPPKWFTKVPDKPLDDEIAEMLRVIEHAVAAATGVSAETAFDVWRQLDAVQSAWGRAHGLPPLLSNFGTSLVERAAIEAVCRAEGVSFATALRRNSFGIRLEELHPELEDCEPRDLLPAGPRRTVIARHTVGMADPLTDDEIAATDRLDDGLPQSLEACIRRYGLRHFKLKVSGDVSHDHDRLGRVAGVLAELAPPDFRFTLDGNEHFRSLQVFREFWQSLSTSTALERFFEHLLFVEQPFHRDVALDPAVLGGLNAWSDRPLLIIDESDAELASCRQALELGYHGTSHKNCKGVFKSIANACLLEQRRRERPREAGLLSGEDLANIGPVALLQDLAVAASLGIESIERNGHHYFAGLSAFPLAVQQQVLTGHGDLYQRSPTGWPTLKIEQGTLALDSVLAAPLGVDFELDVKQFPVTA